MKKVLLMAALLAGSPALWAQGHSDYDTVAGEKPEEVIYRGACTFADLEQVKAFDLQQRTTGYKPAAKKIAALTPQLKNYELLVFLGTWCEDSHHMIPELLRVLQDTGYPLSKLRMYALDRAKTGKNGEEKTYQITNLPTIIVLSDGKEKGRITEVVDKSVESDLLRILEKE